MVTSIDIEGVIIPHAHDVLSGRGHKIGSHPGNQHYRQLVNIVKPEYVSAKKCDKPIFAKLIVKSIQELNPPGRFLSHHQNTNLWVDIGERKAMDKTRQALREDAKDVEDQLKAGTIQVTTEIVNTFNNLNKLHINDVSLNRLMGPSKDNTQGVQEPSSHESQDDTAGAAGTSTACNFNEIVPQVQEPNNHERHNTGTAGTSTFNIPPYIPPSLVLSGPSSNSQISCPPQSLLMNSPSRDSNSLSSSLTSYASVNSSVTAASLYENLLNENGSNCHDAPNESSSPRRDSLLQPLSSMSYASINNIATASMNDNSLNTTSAGCVSAYDTSSTSTRERSTSSNNSGSSNYVSPASMLSDHQRKFMTEALNNLLHQQISTAINNINTISKALNHINNSREGDAINLPYLQSVAAAAATTTATVVPNFSTVYQESSLLKQPENLGDVHGNTRDEVCDHSAGGNSSLRAAKIEPDDLDNNHRHPCTAQDHETDLLTQLRSSLGEKDYRKSRSRKRKSQDDMDRNLYYNSQESLHSSDLFPVPVAKKSRKRRNSQDDEDTKQTADDLDPAAILLQLSQMKYSGNNNSRG